MVSSVSAKAPAHTGSLYLHAREAEHPCDDASLYLDILDPFIRNRGVIFPDYPILELQPISVELVQPAIIGHSCVDLRYGNHEQDVKHERKDEAKTDRGQIAKGRC